MMTDCADDAKAATMPSLARALHMPMSTENQMNVSHAAWFSRQLWHM